MARVLTNNVSLQYAIETSLATAGTLWQLLEPNSISSYGASITTVSRRPISQERGRKKGAVTNLESAVEFEADLTLQAFEDFAEGFVFAEFANKEFKLEASAGTPPPAVDGGGGSLDSYTIATAGTLLSGKITYTAGDARTLIYAKGYTNAANNGLKEVAATVSAVATSVQVATATLATETPTTKASLQIAGVRIGSDADLTLTVSGSTATLVSGGDVSNWATLGLRAGQYICIGSGSRTSPANALKKTSGGSADDTFGYARITSISTSTLNLDKLDANLAATANNSGTGDVDILFGRFLRNVAVTDDADDSRYLERTYTFEAIYPDLGGTGTDEYEYAVGNFANELALNLPLTDKATATWGFIGTNTLDIVGSAGRKSGAATGVGPLRTTALNTSSNIVSLTTDVVSSASDVCFKSLTLTIRNNVSPENCLGTLGASFVNAGLFEVNMEGQMLFTNKAITNAVKNNTTVTFAAVLSNDDGAMVIDLPSMTFGGGDRELPVDQSVLVNLTGETFNDPAGTIPDVSLGISLFPVAP